MIIPLWDILWSSILEFLVSRPVIILERKYIEVFSNFYWKKNKILDSNKYTLLFWRWRCTLGAILSQSKNLFQCCLQKPILILSLIHYTRSILIFINCVTIVPSLILHIECEYQHKQNYCFQKLQSKYMVYILTDSFIVQRPFVYIQFVVLNALVLFNQ